MICEWHFTHLKSPVVIIECKHFAWGFGQFLPINASSFNWSEGKQLPYFNLQEDDFVFLYEANSCYDAVITQTFSYETNIFLQSLRRFNLSSIKASYSMRMVKLVTNASADVTNYKSFKPRFLKCDCISLESFICKLFHLWYSFSERSWFVCLFETIPFVIDWIAMINSISFMW